MRFPAVLCFAPELLRELEVLTHQVAGTLHGRLLQLREETANRSRRWGSIPTGAQIPRTPLGSRLAELASSGGVRAELKARLVETWDRNKTAAPPAAGGEVSPPAPDQPTRHARASPIRAKPSTALRCQARHSDPEHSDPKHGTAIRSTAQRLGHRPGGPGQAPCSRRAGANEIRKRPRLRSVASPDRGTPQG
jgi:hypothetical protein